MTPDLERTAGRLDAGELRMLQLAATGMTSPEIAACLGVTPAEVRGRLLGAISALGARSRLDSVIIALRSGLIGFP